MQQRVGCKPAYRGVNLGLFESRMNRSYGNGFDEYVEEPGYPHSAQREYYEVGCQFSKNL